MRAGLKYARRTDRMLGKFKNAGKKGLEDDDEDEYEYDMVAPRPLSYRPAAVKNVLNSRANRSGSSSGI